MRLFTTVNSAWPAFEPNRLHQGRCGALIGVIELKAMKPRMVTVTSSEMDSEIQKAGRVALYGIYFDFNKADLKPESEPTLAEMSKLLRDEPPVNASASKTSSIRTSPESIFAIRLSSVPPLACSSPWLIGGPTRPQGVLFNCRLTAVRL
jgi:hypothetical protein